MVLRPSLRAGSGQEALPEGSERLGGPSRGPRMIGKPTWMVERHSWMAGSGWEAHPEGQ